MTHPPKYPPAREVELKFAVPAASLDAVARHLAQASSTDAPAYHRHQVTTYFDTQNQILSQHGISLRVRRVDGQRIQTLKADRKASVAADRAEWEWPVDHDEPDLDLLAQTPAAGTLPQNAVLQPMLATDIDRAIHVLRLDGDTVVEAALDQGAIVAGEARQPIRELELELRHGEPAALFRFALQLHSAVPLTIESDSKAARGYRLLAGTHPAVHKADSVTLEPSVSAAQAFRQILGACLGHLLANQPAARTGAAEAVHQMRVAIRRLRAALALFQPYLEPHATAIFQTALRRVGQVFGEARDWDVFCLQILPEALAAEGAAGWHTLLSQPAMLRRDAAYQRFAQELQVPSFTALVLGLAAWVEQTGLFGRDELRQPIKTLGPDLLDRMARKVERRGHDIDHKSDFKLHDLRKSLKKLRYSIEFLQDLFPHKSIKVYLHNCKKLQETLGDINDAVTATALADDLGQAARPDLAPAIGALAKQLERRRNGALHGLAKEWTAFQTTPHFWT